jgi:hypothetical protein
VLSLTARRIEIEDSAKSALGRLSVADHSEYLAPVQVRRGFVGNKLNAAVDERARLLRCLSIAGEEMCEHAQGPPVEWVDLNGIASAGYSSIFVAEVEQRERCNYVRCARGRRELGGLVGGSQGWPRLPGADLRSRELNPRIDVARLVGDDLLQDLAGLSESPLLAQGHGAIKCLIAGRHDQASAAGVNGSSCPLSS